MSDTEWAEIHRKVMAAGLLPGRSVRERLLSLPSIDAFIEVAKASGKTGMLDEAMLDELLAVTPTTPWSHAQSPRLQNPNKPAPRIHDLAHYNLSDFPMQAKDVDADIAVHFDITGKSVTEGKKEDIQSFFNDRLKQVKRLILDRNLPIDR